MRGIVYDTGALVGFERRKPEALHLHRRFAAGGVRPVVPVVVLAQAWRGGPQPDISRMLKGCEILPDSEQIGRAAGAACAAAGTADVVDAIVVMTALRRDAPIATSDPGDLGRITDALGVKIPLLAV
jgi:predicted nucleic acid-binding protein